MATGISLPLMALAAVLQTTIMPQFRVLGGEPDLPFLIVLSWSIHGRTEQAVIWAFVGGICADLLSAAPTGSTVIGLLITVFMVAILRSQMARVGLLSVIGLLIVGTFIHKIVYIVIVGIAGFRTPILAGILFVVIPTLVYNLIVLLPIYAIVRFIQKRTGGDAGPTLRMG